MDKNDILAIFIDFQTRLLPAMHNKEELTKKAVMLAKGIRIFDLPFLVSQQYTKGLGETVHEIKDALGEYTHYEKTSFSIACPVEQKTVIVSGIEAHVCVMQSVLDLLKDGHKVYLIADAVSSRNPYDKEIALRRMQEAGAIITTVEAILFELCVDSKSPHFKDISNLVK